MGPSGLLYLILVLNFLAKGVSAAQECYAVEANVEACGRNWRLTPGIETCIFIDERDKSWASAQRACKARDKRHDLVSAMSFQASKFLRSVVGTHTAWIGLEDKQIERQFVWVNGISNRGQYNWQSYEPDGGSKQNCIFLDEGYWADEGCHKRRKFICQKEHQVGPRQLAMTINWHRPGVFYAGHPASVTCTSFSPVGGRIWWTASKRGKHIPSGLTATTIDSFVLEKNDLNQCGNKTISTYSFQANTTLNGMIISCFTRLMDGHETCPYKATRLAFCAGTRTINFKDGPKSRPNVRFIYKGMPGPVIPNTTVKAECYLVTGPASTITWLVNRQHGIIEPADRNTFKSTLKKLFSKEGPAQISILLFTMERALLGSSLSCFAHDVVTNKMSFDCQPGNQFCAKTEKLRGAETDGTKAISGPRDAKLDVTYHRRLGVVYLGEVFNASCTAKDAAGGVIRWAAYEGGREVDLNAVLEYNNSVSKKERSKDGRPVNVTTSYISVKVSSKLNGATLSCFVDDFPHTETCSVLYGADTYCAVSKTLQVIDGPRGVPELDLEYKGMPGLIDHESNVTANCTVYTGPGGTLMWVFYPKSVPIILLRDDSRVVSYTNGNDARGPYIKSVLEIEMIHSLSGLTIACFAYDAEKHTDDQLCKKADRYCVLTRKIKVRHTNWEAGDSGWHKPSVGFFGMLFVLLITWLLLNQLMVGVVTQEGGNNRSVEIVLTEHRESQKSRKSNESGNTYSDSGGTDVDGKGTLSVERPRSIGTSASVRSKSTLV